MTIYHTTTQKIQHVHKWLRLPGLRPAAAPYFDEISERLEYIPAQFVVKRYVRPQYSCDDCQRVVSGRLPAQIIPKSILEPGLVAQVLVSKFCDHQPLYHQQ